MYFFGNLVTEKTQTNQSTTGQDLTLEMLEDKVKVSFWFIHEF